MKQAICTKMLKSNGHKGPRIKAVTHHAATGAPKSFTDGWNFAVSAQANHCAAAKALAHKLGHSGCYAGGHIPSGIAWVWIGDDHPSSGEEGMDWFCA